MSDEFEELEVAEDDEGLAYILTVIAHKLNPKVNLGRTYEIYLTMIVELLNGHAMTEEDALLFGQRILDTMGADDGDALH